MDSRPPHTPKIFHRRVRSLGKPKIYGYLSGIATTINELKEEKEENDVQREYNITINELKNIIDQPQLLEKTGDAVIAQFNEFLVNRWERIRGTDLAYPHAPQLPANQLCVKIAWLIYRRQPEVLEEEKIVSPNSILMHTIRKNEWVEVDFNGLALHEFILSDDDKDFIPLKKVFDEMENSKNFITFDPTKPMSTRNLSDSEFKRLTNHSGVAQAYYEAWVKDDKVGVISAKPAFHLAMKEGVEVTASYGQRGQLKLKRIVQAATIENLVQNNDESLFDYLDAKKSKEERLADFDEAMVCLADVMKHNTAASEGQCVGIKVFHHELKRTRNKAAPNELPLLTELIYRLIDQFKTDSGFKNYPRYLVVANTLQKSPCCRIVAGVALIMTAILLAGLAVVLGLVSGGVAFAPLLAFGEAVGYGVLSGVSAVASIATGAGGAYLCLRSKYYSFGAAALTFFPPSKSRQKKASETDKKHEKVSETDKKHVPRKSQSKFLRDSSYRRLDSEGSSSGQDVTCSTPDYLSAKRPSLNSSGDER